MLRLRDKNLTYNIPANIAEKNTNPKNVIKKFIQFLLASLTQAEAK